MDGLVDLFETERSMIQGAAANAAIDRPHW
jgi:hypothetical protein